MPATRRPNSASIPKSAAKAVWDAGQVRGRADRRDRARDQARRHRLPDQPRRACRPRGALRPPGHDLVGRARHLPRRPAHPAPPTCCSPISTRVLAALKRARDRAQADADDRPQPRHPCRADDVRAEAGAGTTPSSPAAASGWSRRAREVATCAISGAVGTFANIDPRVEAHVAEKLGLEVEPVSTQVIPRDRHAAYLRDARRDRRVDRAPRDRDPPPAAHRGARGRGILQRRARRARRRCRTSATRC